MDIGTIAGIGLGFGFILMGISLGGSVGDFIDLPSMFITVGGSIAAILVSFPLQRVINSFKVLRVAMFAPKRDYANTIATIVSFAEKARKEGLLSLEDEIQNLEDPFLKKGLQLVVDGADPELVKGILEIEMSFLEERHKEGRSVFSAVGDFAPAFGMIGTLIGLVIMLKNLNDPSSIGPSMATALITTFYGAVLANLIGIPLANKLAARSQEELLEKMIMIEGIVSLQAGENPRVLEEKLLSFLPPSQRKHSEEEGG